MLVKQAKDIARQWVATQAAALPGFRGAFFHGSINDLPDEAELSGTSDIDVMVVLETADLPDKPGKLIDRGVLVEVTYLPMDQLRSAEQVLGVSHLAGSLRADSLIQDPSGALTGLHTAVADGFARREWVVQRCEHARGKALAALRGLEVDGSFPEQAIRWLFGAGLTTHVLLAAGLKNPTVRKRYLAVRGLLAEYGYDDFYLELLELLGCAGMTPARCTQHLDRLAAAFDAAASVIHSPFYFAADITEIARPIAIDGSRELIAHGDHREAVFWLAVTYSRCLIVLDRDAPPGMRERHEPGYHELLADLAIHSISDLRQRGKQVEAFLPRLWQVAQDIIAATLQDGLSDV